MTSKGEDEHPKPRHFVVDHHLSTLLSGPLASRRAEQQAGYLLDYLEPQFDLLDIGCGPGSITLGFAKHLPEGSVTGIDVSDEHIATARKQPALNNTTFKTGDAYALPCQDQSFDVVHAHALFQHLSNPGKALEEIWRVLRPGGILALADWDKEAVLLHPEANDLQASLSWLQQINRQANAMAGRQLASLVEGTGFKNPAMGVMAQGMSQKDLMVRHGQMLTESFESATLRAMMVDMNLATTQELDALAEGWRKWSQTPGAIFVTHWFYCVSYR